MTQTMRERLIAAAEAVLISHAHAFTGEPTEEAGAAIVDAILAELREPDDDMKDAEYAARRKPLRANQDVRYRTFTAMIDAVREGK